MQKRFVPLCLGLSGLLAMCVLAAPAARNMGANPLPPSQAGYSVPSIVASGQRGGMLVPVGERFSAADNKNMGAAMELWNAHQWEAAVARLTAFYQTQKQ